MPYVPAGWCMRCRVRNNIVDTATGAGIALYSARDAVVVQNSLLVSGSVIAAGTVAVVCSTAVPSCMVMEV